MLPGPTPGRLLGAAPRGVDPGDRRKEILCAGLDDQPAGLGVPGSCRPANMTHITDAERRMIAALVQGRAHNSAMNPAPRVRLPWRRLPDGRRWRRPPSFSTGAMSPTRRRARDRAQPGPSPTSRRAGQRAGWGGGAWASSTQRRARRALRKAWRRVRPHHQGRTTCTRAQLLRERQGRRIPILEDCAQRWGVANPPSTGRDRRLSSPSMPNGVIRNLLSRPNDGRALFSPPGGARRMKTTAANPEPPDVRRFCAS